ncbi:MAG: sodium:calcium symporter [bacterium]|nr:sodium:calcium symporter [bacterium]
MKANREMWGSKLGVILAVAGSAIGLGNFLRFPTQAVIHGGGAFLVPYFISLLLLGIPLMWMEWTIGRYGGGFGHGTAPGVFQSLWKKNRFIKYFGVIGIFGPLVILIYYTYIESWLLGYTFYSLTPKFQEALATGQIANFLSGYQGLEKNQFFSSLIPAYLFFLVTFFTNFAIISRGINKGVAKLCKVALPFLFVMGIILVIRILMIDGISTGFKFLWTPDFSMLKSAKVWLAAAGQVFFTLSVGIGVILTYSSYLKKTDDIVSSGLSSVATNEFAEIILGSSIIIPAAFLFFGGNATVEIAGSGAFNLSFVTMPIIFAKMKFGLFFAFIWFLLLFIAGITSSISLIQPSISFLEDEFDISHEKAVKIIGLFCFVLCHIPILFISKGVLGELDFWAGTFCLVLFATIEAFLFSWVFGINEAWKEIHHGATIGLPRIYKFIMKYVTPFFLLIILVNWIIQEGIPVILMHNVAPENKAYILMTRIVLLLIFFILVVMVKVAWRKRKLSSDS